MPGAPTSIDDAGVPYGGSHRLITSGPTTNGHGSTEAGGASSMLNGRYQFLPAWEQMYTGAP